MKKHFLLTPGPTPIPPDVAKAESMPILHHRTKEFSEIFIKVIEGLKYVLQTKEDVFIMASSGTGAMESAVVNLASPGDKVLVASCGVFGNRFERICRAFGLEVIKLEAEWGKAVNPEDIESQVKQNPEIKVVFTTHTETSTGVVNDLKSIGEITKNYNVVLCVDAISGLCGQELRMDEWNLDIVVSASQKGLMCAPGLSLVGINQKAWKLIERSKLPKFYWDYKRMREFIPKVQTPFTPAVSLVVSLCEALKIIKSKTLEIIWQETEKLAVAVRAAVKEIGLELFADEKCACNVLTSVKMPQGIDSELLVDTMRDEFGVSIAEGQDKLKGKIFRIAHMGYIDKTDVSVALSCLEILLNRFDYKVEYGKSVGRFLRECDISK